MRLAAPQRNHHLSNSHGPCHRTVSVVNVLENNGKAAGLDHLSAVAGAVGGVGIDPKSSAATDIGSELQTLNFLPRSHNHNNQFYHSHAPSHHSSHSQDSHVSSGGGGGGVGGKFGSSGHVAKDGSSSSHSQEYS